MKKLLILLFSLLISFNSYGGIGDKYFCEEKEDEEGVGKHKTLMDWTENSVIQKDIPNQNLVDSSKTATILINKNNYFVSTFPYGEGHLIETFDGETLTSVFVRNSYTYVNEYICTKL